MLTLLPPARENTKIFREKALKSLDRLPPLAPAVGRLLSKLAFKGVDYRELASFVEKDALLCAHILRTVNSAAFARSRTITSVSQAMSLLGTNALRRIAVGFTVSNLFSRVKAAPTWSRMRFNLHSGATGILTEAMVENMPVENKDGAFVSGMLHDLGRLLIAVGLHEHYETITTRHELSGRPVFECEREIIHVDHAELSCIALTKWGIPDNICRAVGHHHDPESKDAPWLSMVIHRADRFVNHLGIAILPTGVVAGDPPSMEIPGFEYDQAAVLQKFEREWIELSEFFQ